MKVRNYNGMYYGDRYCVQCTPSLYLSQYYIENAHCLESLEILNIVIFIQYSITYYIYILKNKISYISNTWIEEKFDRYFLMEIKKYF